MIDRLSLLLALPLSLGGCAAVGFAPAMVEAARETAAAGSRYTDESFGPAAEEACRARAARHGRVEISRVEQHGGASMRVYGTVDRFGRSQGRSFACIFRRDGNLPYFRLS